MKQFFGFCGFAGSGKDTAARYLQRKYDYRLISFADSLKDCLAVMLGWDREMLSGTTAASRKWREAVDPWWSERLGIPEFTPRFAMTRFGTEAMRDHFHQDIWVLATERKVQSLGNCPIIITDVRFPNEVDMVRRNGGKMTMIKRQLPEWFDIGVEAAQGDQECVGELRRLGVHESEWKWLGTKYDAIVENTTFEELDQQMEKMHQAWV